MVNPANEDRVPVWVQPADRELIQQLVDLCETTTGAYGHPVFQINGLSRPTGPQELSGNSFVQQGTCWNITYGPDSVHLIDSVGVRCIAHLVNAPYEHVPVTELSMWAHGTETTLAPLHLGKPPETLDQQSVSSLLNEVRRLQEKAEDAQALGDDYRAEELRSQIEDLVDSVESSRRKGGRSRRFVDEVEKARQATHKNVRRSCRDISRFAPRLGAHFTQSISISRYCSYTPSQETRWTVQFSAAPAA